MEERRGLKRKKAARGGKVEKWDGWGRMENWRGRVRTSGRNEDTERTRGR